jgi:hypothetical protein
VESDQVHPEDEGQKGDEGNHFMYPFSRNQLTATTNSQSNLAEPEITVSALFVSVARLPVCPRSCDAPAIQQERLVGPTRWAEPPEIGGLRNGTVALLDEC